MWDKKMYHKLQLSGIVVICVEIHQRRNSYAQQHSYEDYQQIEQSILNSSQLNELPDSINVNALDEGGIARTLINHCAKHHRPALVSQAEDRAAQKRNVDEDTDIIQKPVTRIRLDGKNKL